MQLEYAYLANSAGFLQDGRLVVFGADIEGVETNGFPAVASNLVIVSKFWIMPDDPLEGHTVSIDITMPSGHRSSITANEPLNTMRNRRDAMRPSAAQVIVNLVMVMEEAGNYLFHLIADGHEVKTIPLYAAQTGPGAAIPENAAS